MTANRHILLLTEFFHPDICASAVVAADQLDALAALRPDWRFTVIAGNRAWHDPERVYPALQAVGRIEVVRVARPPLGARSMLSRALGFAAYYRRAIVAARQLGPLDLVIGTTAPPIGGRLARAIAACHRCPFVYKVYDLYPDTAVTLGRLRPNALIARAWLRDDQRTMQQAAAVVCIADGIRDRLLRTRQLDSRRIHAIHDGFDPARLDRAGQSGEAPAAGASTTGARFTVQYAGNMGLSHPFDTILDAAGRLADDADMAFEFIGDGPGRAALAASLPRRAELLPFQPEDRFAARLAAADVCLVTQHTGMFDQALPYKVYAILAAAKSLIFVGNPGSEIAGWLRSADCGLTVPQGDGRALADAIAHLKADATRRVEMGRRARTLFDARFHIGDAARRWAELLDQVLAAGGA